MYYFLETKKKWSFWPKKFSLLNFFAAFLITNVISMKLRQSSAFYDFVDALLISYDGVWNKKKLSRFFSISKTLWNFEYFCMHSLFQFELKPLIMLKLGAIKFRLKSEFVSEGAFSGLYAWKKEVLKFFRIYLTDRE